MANFVYEAEQFKKSDDKLTEEEYDKFQELMELRNNAWNAKGSSICMRAEKKNKYCRASTAHQNGEQDAAELYNQYYKLAEKEKEMTKELKQAQKKLVTTYEQVGKELKKKFKSFIQKVDTFMEKAQEIYKFEPAEESEDEEEKQYGKTFFEFEGID